MLYYDHYEVLEMKSGTRLVVNMTRVRKKVTAKFVGFFQFFKLYIKSK